MSLSEQIKSARKNANLTQQQLAELIGVAKSTIAGYEKGDREPDAVKLKLIAKHTGVSGSYLLELDDNCTNRENYNGLNAEEARQFAQGVSNEAMRIALLYDSLDEHGQEILNAIASIESGRIELANAAQGIAELDRIGAKRLGSFAGLPHYEMGNPSVSSAKYFARAERAELEKEEVESK